MQLNKNDIFGKDDLEGSDVVVPTVGFFDFIKCKEEIESSAKNILNSIVDIYFKGKIIDKPTYLDLKKEMDKKTLVSLMYSLETNQHICTKICEQIDAGDMTPRLLEVYSKIQLAILDIVKVKTNYINIIEDNYRKMAEELEDQTDNAESNMLEPSNSSAQGAFQTVGSKKMIKHIRENTDVEFIEIDNDKYDAKERAKKDLEKEEEDMKKLAKDYDEDLYFGSE